MQLDEAYKFLTAIRPCGPKRVRGRAGGAGWAGRGGAGRGRQGRAGKAQAALAPLGSTRYGRAALCMLSMLLGRGGAGRRSCVRPLPAQRALAFSSQLGPLPAPSLFSSLPCLTSLPRPPLPAPQDAIRGATFDLLDRRDWKEFERLPDHAWACLSPEQKATIRAKIMALPHPGSQ